jgi:dihydroorotase
VITLPRAIALLTSGPAQTLGLPYGRLSVGSSADVCIFDPEYPWELTAEQIQSAGHNTPFLGWEFTGRVTHTLFEGRVVYSDRNRGPRT